MTHIPTSRALSAAQIHALEALLRGQTVTEAAKVAKVDRSTVHRWQREDFDFQAAFNRGRMELVSAMQVRVMRMAARAVEVVEEAIDGGDARAAMQILDSLGLLEPSRLVTGADDPE